MDSLTPYSSTSSAAQTNRKKRVDIALIVAIFCILIFAFIMLPPMAERLILKMTDRSLKISKEQELEVVKIKDQLSKEIALLTKRYQEKTPKATYIVINTSANEFSLYKGFELIKKDKCSTGSYILLKKGDQQQWMFKTPKGEFKIRSKKKEPVWKKPDWAFVEAGLPVPSANHSSRFEYGVLGDYALTLGDGYLIHGTLYQRFLGLPVTHGCVRLNDENLALVYKTLNVGAKVYIY